MDDVQNKPLEAAVQSVVPQAQVSELTELPSTTEHGALRQVFVDDVQYKPFEAAVQSLVPQAQLPELTELPSTTEHGA